ncbi:MAG: hypothetical protein K9J85_10170 [Desulfobacteraceae bacterium]|nr:hypothetical protein [Desulfobacteraceae bacterium]
MKIIRCTAFCAALAFALIAAGSCGKKAPPKAPENQNLPLAEKLESEIRGNSLILKWSLRQSPEEKISDPAGFVVYRAKTPVGKDCPGCPVNFERAGWVAYRSGRIVPETWYFEDTVEPGYVYRYRIRCYSDTGRLGRESETVKYTMRGSNNDD